MSKIGIQVKKKTLVIESTDTFESIQDKLKEIKVPSTELYVPDHNQSSLRVSFCKNTVFWINKYEHVIAFNWDDSIISVSLLLRQPIDLNIIRDLVIINNKENIPLYDTVVQMRIFNEYTRYLDDILVDISGKPIAKVNISFIAKV